MDRKMNEFLWKEALGFAFRLRVKSARNFDRFVWIVARWKELRFEVVVGMDVGRHGLHRSHGGGRTS